MIDRGLTRPERHAPTAGRILLRLLIGGFAVGIYFGLHHAWGDASTAAAVGAVSAAGLAAFTFIAEAIDHDFSRSTLWPPWWWYF
ncbi:hypothetical protein [Candidatus Burkholderia verschuerenii]|uniref:hypothetical protein n=1 Tax=Candidatus Burkholderia verschuerenii TaxID=242163 RepID=UPI00067E6091|nr:hypothetical protein [Candidatus Burkholderia verschuerenii]